MKRSHLIGMAALSGAMGVMAGAFGAHGATGKPAEWLRIGAEYQMIHAVAALVGARMRAWWPGALLLAGSVLFAATLYAMALGGPPWLGAVTPLGGVGMIAGWIGMSIDAFRLSDRGDLP